MRDAVLLNAAAALAAFDERSARPARRGSAAGMERAAAAVDDGRAAALLDRWVTRQPGRRAADALGGLRVGRCSKPIEKAASRSWRE